MRPDFVPQTLDPSSKVTWHVTHDVVTKYYRCDLLISLVFVAPNVVRTVTYRSAVETADLPRICKQLPSGIDLMRLVRCDSDERGSRASF